MHKYIYFILIFLILSSQAIANQSEQDERAVKKAKRLYDKYKETYPKAAECFKNVQIYKEYKTCKKTFKRVLRERRKHFKNMDFSDKSTQLSVVQQDPSAIKRIPDPYKEVQLFVVQQDPMAIRYIKKPLKEVQIAAIKEDPRSIRYIGYPTNEIQLLAVSKDPKAIEYIKKPTIEVTLAVKGKAVIPFTKPNFKATAEHIELRVTNGVLSVVNKTQKFMKISALSEYIADDIYQMPLLKLSPDALKKIDIVNKDTIIVNALEGTVLFGYAVEYQVGNGIVEDLYKTQQYTYTIKGNKVSFTTP